MTKPLVAIHAITHKPNPKAKKVTDVAPGSVFTPVDEDEREFFLRQKAARELTETEAEVGSAKKAPAKKAAPKADTPPAAPEAPAPEPEKAIPMDSEPGDTTTSDTDESLLD